MAKLTEQSERYDDMIVHVKALTSFSLRPCSDHEVFAVTLGSERHFVQYA